MALYLKYFYYFGVCLSILIPGIVPSEIDEKYKFLSRKIDEVLTETKNLNSKVQNIDNRVKKVEEKLQGLQTSTPNSIDLMIRDKIQDLKIELKAHLDMQNLAVEKMLSEEKMLLRESRENLNVSFAELKSEIQTQMSVVNATLTDEFDNRKSVIQLEMLKYNKTREINLKDTYEIGNTSSMMLEKGIAELTSDLNSTKHNVSQILQTMERTMVSNIEEIEKRMLVDVQKEQNKTLQSITHLKADVDSLSTNISSFASVLFNRISSESSSLSSNISSLSSSLSSQISTHSNRLYLLEERIDECISNQCMNNATCVDGHNSYSCICLPGYTGTNCQIEIDECSSTPCMNNATCVDGFNSYRCRCLSGYNGTYCQIDYQNFQLDFPSTASIRNYAIVPLAPDLRSVTACFWMKTDDEKNQGTPFSYATKDGDNIFTLTDYDGFIFYVNGEKVTTTIKANSGDWHHVCVMWSSNRGSWKMYMDGVPLDSGRNLANGQTIKGGGRFVIGQEQDALGGGFSSPESFIGQLTQLNVWSRELSLEDILLLRQSCVRKTGDVISWTDIFGNIQGSVTGSIAGFCKDCSLPEQVENGNVENNGLSAGSFAEYSCSRGFIIAGRRRRLCLVTGEWEGRVPICARVQCGNPGQIANGWIEGTRFTFSNRIRYFCDRGYKLVGSATRYCGEFGFWEEDAPVCELIKCSIPVLSENTLVQNPSSDNTYAPGSEASFVCTPGNNFYTEHTSVFCQRDGTWDKSIPTCDPLTCKAPPVIAHGQFQNPNNLKEFPVAFIAQYVCEFGYNFSKNSVNQLGIINCLPTGQWESHLPECTVIMCDKPTDIDHGTYLATGQEFLAQVTYICDKGYVLTHDDVLECYEPGEWIPAPPECLPVRCGPPDDILHGSFEGDAFSYKDTIRYRCNLGYIIVGNEQRECLENSSWSGALPVCKPMS